MRRQSTVILCSWSSITINTITFLFSWKSKTTFDTFIDRDRKRLQGFKEILNIEYGFGSSYQLISTRDMKRITRRKTSSVSRFSFRTYRIVWQEWRQDQDRMKEGVALFSFHSFLMYSSFSSSVSSVKNKNQELSEYPYIACGIHSLLKFVSWKYSLPSHEECLLKERETSGKNSKVD